MRFERLETRATPHIDDDEVHRVYRESVMRHYGTDADVGMYEVDACRTSASPSTPSRTPTATRSRSTRLRPSTSGTSKR
jgi:hypothetical protein